MQELKIGPKSLLVISLPHIDFDRGESVRRLIIGAFGAAGIEIDNERTMVVDRDVDFTVIDPVDHQPESKLGPSVDALALAFREQEIKRWKFVALGGNEIPTTAQLLDDVSNWLRKAPVDGDYNRASRDNLAGWCASRAAFIRSHLKDGVGHDAGPEYKVDAGPEMSTVKAEDLDKLTAAALKFCRSFTSIVKRRKGPLVILDNAIFDAEALATELRLAALALHRGPLPVEHEPPPNESHKKS